MTNAQPMRSPTQWLGLSMEMAGAARWQWLAAVPSMLGFGSSLVLRLAAS